MPFVGTVPPGLRGVTAYANLAAAMAGVPGLNPVDYLCANDLQLALAGTLISSYTAFNSNSRVDVGKTRSRQIYLANLQAGPANFPGTPPSGWTVADYF